MTDPELELGSTGTAFIPWAGQISMWWVSKVVVVMEFLASGLYNSVTGLYDKNEAGLSKNAALTTDMENTL